MLFSAEESSPVAVSHFFIENMNYPTPAEVQTDFIDHSSQLAWNSPPNVPTAWGHAGLISSPVSAAQPCWDLVLSAVASLLISLGL